MAALQSPAPLYRRDVALDGLRTLAVLLMIASHTTRLIAWDARREWSRFSLLIEPLTASLFLMLVGASLAHSWRGAQARGLERAAWLRKQALRALALWAVSCLFYSLEDGFRLPDAVTMSGILATIAYAILVCSLLVSRQGPIPLLALAFAGLMALDIWMDRNGHRVFILNAGNSPLLPLLTFACLGALGAFALEAGRGGRALRATLVACALLALGLVLWRHSFQEVFSKPIGRYETARSFAIGTGDVSRVKRIPYYNLRPILVPVIASLAVLLYAALALLRPWLERSARFLFPMGRRSLDVYVLHLFLLALLVLRGGKRPLSETWQGDAVVLAVTGLCYAWALGRDRFPFRLRPSGRGGAGPGG
jgi:hypothetical protein